MDRTGGAGQKYIFRCGPSSLDLIDENANRIDPPKKSHARKCFLYYFFHFVITFEHDVALNQNKYPVGYI